MDHYEYRVWDIKTEQYLTEMHLDQIYRNMKGKGIWYSHKGFSDISDSVIIEDWTGLEDIKKKGIYKNDIILAESRENPGHYAYYRVDYDRIYGSWVGTYLKGFNSLGHTSNWPLGELRFTASVVANANISSILESGGKL